MPLEKRQTTPRLKTTGVQLRCFWLYFYLKQHLRCRELASSLEIQLLA